MISVRAYRYNTKLDAPISISFHTWYFRENVLIELEYNGEKGYGEAAPFKPITGDSQEEVIKEVKKISSIPLDPEKDGLTGLDTYVQTIHSYTLKAAIDFAYHDLLGKLKGVPVYALYQPTPTLVDNSVTVFIKDTVEETAAEAARLYKAFPEMKILKIKLKGENDVERTKAIKSVSPSHMKFIVDANQGFTDEKKAVADLTEVGNILRHVILVEEPCPKGELAKLKYVKENVPNMLVFADESAATYEDAKAVVTANAAHGINIKLQKAGGIAEGKKIAKLCEEKELKIMVGSMLDGPIATAASIHFAISTKHVILSDQDMDLEMPSHETGKLAFTNGQRIPNNVPGFGITFDMDKINNLVQKGEMVFEEV